MPDTVSKSGKIPEQKKLNTSKEKRIRRKQKKTKTSDLKFVGNNANGLANKLESLENILKDNPSVLFIQETHLQRTGKIKTPSAHKYTWYELIRTSNASKGEKGGGLAIGVLNVLQPSWISEGDDEAEAITVEIWVEDFPICLICGYGPQEYDKTHRKEKFWSYLHLEVKNATKNGAALVIQMDGNLWAGKSIIKDDPKEQNQNGKYFETFLNQNKHLSVVNALPLCSGVITRRRYTKNGVQESILDFFVVCDKMLPLVNNMTIDADGYNSLTKYKDTVVKSDHMKMEMEANLIFHKEEQHER